jgi:acetoin utilization deacetylase AcuC-like enzyme
MSTHRHNGIKKVAIVDFDVHHGNGTEAIIENLVPVTLESYIKTPFCTGSLTSTSYAPWVGEDDPKNVLFVSVHGYGKKDPDYDHVPQAPWFYPGSGKTGCSGECCGDEEAKSSLLGKEAAAAAAADIDGMDVEEGGDDDAPSAAQEPDHDGHSEHDCVAKDESDKGKPQVLNIGLPWKPAAAARRQWRDAYRDHVFPRLMEFKPDLLFISAGECR